LAQPDPFESATKQVNDACDVLGINDKGIRDYLIMPNRFLRVKVPVKMDDGKIRVRLEFLQDSDVSITTIEVHTRAV